MSLSIINGKVMINGKLESKNILVEDGKIKDIGDSSDGEVLNAEGRIILPGLIDCHVHLREPGLTNKEDFLTGTKAAAAGGVTTILEMPNTVPPTTTVKNLKQKKKRAQKAIVNYGIYMGALGDNADEIKKATNIAGVKLYMGASTGNMVVTDKKTIKELFSSGRMIVVHAEDELLMQKNSEEYKNSKDASVHVKIRTNETETKAVKEALEIAGDERVHITHVSTKESVELLRKSNASCDVTPHHLFLTEKELEKQGNFAKMNPPLRSFEDVEALWQGINEGVINCVATDHAPHLKEEKKADYWKAPAGVPGLETMLPLLLDAVNKGKIKLKKVAELTSFNPAKLFGIKNKGKIEIGMDADLVIVDMEKEKEVKNEELFTKCKWSPFNGWKLKGWPVTTIVNGQIVYNEGKISDLKGREVEFNETS
jgi:dihydroorotase